MTPGLSIRTTGIIGALLGLIALAAPGPACAFWLLGFSTADTLGPGQFSAIAGTGGQFTRVGDPKTDNFTPFLPHAGFRAGLADGWDIGYRLTQVALPFSSVGPSLGGEIDVKRRLTSPTSPWQVAVVGGFAYSYLDVMGQSRSAYSPGGDLILSHALGARTSFISEVRYVYTAIPTAKGGGGANHFTAAGGDLGLKFALRRTISLVPEVGLFDFTGRLAGRNADGLGAQYGAVLAFRF